MKVVANMNLKTLVGWLNKMKETTVTMQIPRFRIEDSLSLKEELVKMGLEDLFSATRASLPGTTRFLVDKPDGELPTAEF